MTDPAIVWLRQDLRLADQPAFVAAAAEGAVIPVYVLDDEAPPRRYRIGGAQRWWLHGSLESLARDLTAAGSRLVLRRGRADVALAELMAEAGAARVHAVRHAEPWWRAAEAELGERLTLHDGNTLAPLRDVVTGGGRPFRIYSAFWRAAGPCAATRARSRAGQAGHARPLAGFG